jgi:hypothetical protein
MAAEIFFRHVVVKRFDAIAVNGIFHLALLERRQQPLGNWQ